MVSPRFLPAPTSMSQLIALPFSLSLPSRPYQSVPTLLSFSSYLPTYITCIALEHFLLVPRLDLLSLLLPLISHFSFFFLTPASLCLFLPSFSLPLLVSFFPFFYVSTMSLVPSSTNPSERKGSSLPRTKHPGSRSRTSTFLDRSSSDDLARLLIGLSIRPLNPKINLHELEMCARSPLRNRRNRINASGVLFFGSCLRVWNPASSKAQACDDPRGRMRKISSKERHDYKIACAKREKDSDDSTTDRCSFVPFFPLPSLFTLLSA